MTSFYGGAARAERPERPESSRWLSYGELQRVGACDDRPREAQVQVGGGPASAAGASANGANGANGHGHSGSTSTKIAGPQAGGQAEAKGGVGAQSMTHYGRNVRRAMLGGVDAELYVNSATSAHSRLNRAIEAAKSPAELLVVLDESLDDFDAFHCVLAVHRLARSGRLLGAPAILRHRRWPDLVRRLRGDVDAAEPRQISSIAWSFANLRYADRGFMDAVAERCISRELGRWDPMSLSLVPQSFAMIRAAHPGLLESISAHVRRESSATWGPNDVSRVVWSWAKLLHRDDALFRDASCKLISRLPECSPGVLAQTVWAFATVAPRETAEAHLFPRVAAVMRGPGLKEHSPAHLAMAVWAFAAVLFRPVELLEEIGNVLPQITERHLNSQDISMTAWSYATLLAPQRSVFGFLAAAAPAAAHDFNAQDLANTAWAFATAGEYNAPLLDALGDEACSRPQDFNNQHTSMLIWAYVTLKHHHGPLFALAGSSAQVDKASWSSGKLLAYALAGLPRLHADLGDRASTLRVAGSLVSSLLERERCGLGEADDAHTVHDAVYPLLGPTASELLDPEAWREVEAMVAAQRRRLASLARSPAFDAVLPGASAEVLTYNVDEVREYQCAVQALGLRGLGSAHTWLLFQEAGLRRGGKELATPAVEGLKRPEPLRPGQEPGRGERANRCYWQVRLSAPGPDSVRRSAEGAGRTLSSTVVNYREECAGLVAVKLSHDRVTHRAWDCEFRAMARTAAAARALLAGLPAARVQSFLDVGASEEPPAAEGLGAVQGRWHGESSVEGLLRIHMTEVPCLSCVCAFLQFRRRFPGVEVEVNWDGMPAEACGHAACGTSGGKDGLD